MSYILDGNGVILTADNGDQLTTDIPAGYLTRLVAMLRLRLHI